MTSYGTPFVARYLTNSINEYRHVDLHESMYFYPHISSGRFGTFKHGLDSTFTIEEIWAFLYHAIETQEVFHLWQRTGFIEPARAYLKDKIVISHIEWNHYIDIDKTKLEVWNPLILRTLENFDATR